MERRRLGKSGLTVPALSFGAGTFGGKGPLFSAWGATDATEATRLVDICLEAGVNLFDTADVYSDGASEEILGARNEAQLRDNLGAAGWSLTAEQIARLDAASDVTPPYPHTPYRQQDGFARLNPPVV